MMSFIGRNLGYLAGFLAAHRFKNPALQLILDGQEVGLKVVLALTDVIILDRIVGAVWPAGLVLAAMIGIDLFGNLLGSPEAVRVLIGLLVLAALVWAIEGLVRGSRLMVPHVRFWLVTRLRPRRHLRLVLYHSIREGLSSSINREKLGGLLHGTIDIFLQKISANPDQISFEIARNFAPQILLHVIHRFITALIPFVAIILYYRLILYPQFVRAFSGGLSTWRVAAYPVAALLDLLFASHFRLALTGQV